MKVSCAVNHKSSIPQCIAILTKGTKLEMHLVRNDNFEMFNTMDVGEIIVSSFVFCFLECFFIGVVTNKWFGYCWVSQLKSDSEPVLTKWSMISGDISVCMSQYDNLIIATSNKILNSFIKQVDSSVPTLQEPIELKLITEIGPQSTLLSFEEEFIVSMHGWKDSSDLILITRGKRTNRFSIRWSALESGQIRLIWSLTFTSSRISATCISSVNNMPAVVIVSRSVVSVGSAAAGITAQFDLCDSIINIGREICAVGIAHLLSGKRVDEEARCLTSLADGRYFQVHLSNNLQSMAVTEQISSADGTVTPCLPCCEEMFLIGGLSRGEDDVRGGRISVLGVHAQFGVQLFTLENNSNFGTLEFKPDAFLGPRSVSWKQGADRVINIERLVVSQYNPVDGARCDGLLSCCTSRALNLSVMYRMEKGHPVDSLAAFALDIGSDSASSFRVLPAEPLQSSASEVTSLLVFSSSTVNASSLFALHQDTLCEGKVTSGSFVGNDVTLGLLRLEGGWHVQVTPNHLAVFSCETNGIHSKKISPVNINELVTSIANNSRGNRKASDVRCSICVEVVSRDGNHIESEDIGGEEFARRLGGNNSFTVEHFALVNNTHLLVTHSSLLLLLRFDMSSSSNAQPLRVVRAVLATEAVSCAASCSSFVAVALWDSPVIQVRELGVNGELPVRMMLMGLASDGDSTSAPIRHLAMTNVNVHDVTMLVVVTADDLGRVAVYVVDALKSRSLTTHHAVKQFSVFGGVVGLNCEAFASGSAICRFIISTQTSRHLLSCDFTTWSVAGSWICAPLIPPDLEGKNSAMFFMSTSSALGPPTDIPVGWVEWLPRRQSAVLHSGVVRTSVSKLQVRRKVSVAGVVDQLEMHSPSDAVVVASWVDRASGGRSVGVFDAHSLKCLWTQTLQLGADVVTKIIGGAFVPHMRVEGFDFSRTICGGVLPAVFTLVQLTGLHSGLPGRLDVTSFILKRNHDCGQQPGQDFVCSPIGTVSVTCDALQREEDAQHWHTRAVLTAPVGNHSVAVVMPRNRIVVVGWSDNSTADLRSSSLVASLSWQCEYCGLDETSLVVDLAAASHNLLLVSAAQVGVHVLRVVNRLCDCDNKLVYSVEPLYLHVDSGSLLARMRAVCATSEEEEEETGDDQCVLRVVASDRYKYDQGVLLTVWLVEKMSSMSAAGGDVRPSCSSSSSSLVPLLSSTGAPLDYSVQSVAAVVCVDNTLDVECGRSNGGKSVVSDFVFLDEQGDVIEGIFTDV